MILLSDALILACAAKANSACEVILHYLAKGLMLHACNDTLAKLWSHAMVDNQKDMTAEIKRVIKAICIEVAIKYLKDNQTLHPEWESLLDFAQFRQHFEALKQKADKEQEMMWCKCARCKRDSADPDKKLAMVRCLKGTRFSATCRALDWGLELC